MYRLISLLLFISISLMFVSCGGDKNETKEFKVAFLSNRGAADRQFNIFISDTSGANLKNLTGNRSDVRTFSAPKFSDDQNYIFYTSVREGGTYLNVIDLMNDTIRSVTSLNRNNSKPLLIKSKNLVFFIDKEDEINHIYSVSLNGEDRKIVTNNALDIFEFDVSENTGKIVYSARQGNSTSLFLTDLKGSMQKQLTDSKGDDINPDFSSDGSKIIFSSSRDAAEKNDFDIYMVNPDGEDLHIIYDSNFYDASPEFSPDGEAIAFLSNRRGMKYRDVLYMDIDGDNNKNLTSALGTINQNYSFSPGGKFIVFENIKTINADIYLVNIKTGKFINVSDDPSWDTSPTL